MTTFRDLQDRINLDYLNRTDLTNETKRAIIRAIKHYEKNRFWFNMTSTALAIGSASVTVAVPADFLALDYVTVRDSSIDYVVTIRNFDRIAYKNQNMAGGVGSSASGIVAECAYFRNTLYFTPKPASATSLTVYYTQTFAALSADSDTNDWCSAAEDLIVHHATADMLANVLRVTDQSQIMAHKQWELEAYNQLKTGNDIRLMVNQDVGVIGTNHQQFPKAPDTSLPTFGPGFQQMGTTKGSGS